MIINQPLSIKLPPIKNLPPATLNFKLPLPERHLLTNQADQITQTVTMKPVKINPVKMKKLKMQKSGVMGSKLMRVMMLKGSQDYHNSGVSDNGHTNLL